MGDFDLSQAQEGPLDSDETGFKSTCFNDADVQEEVITIDEGVELRVSCSKPTMRKVANLVLAASRWKKWTGLSDKELCSAIMEDVLEEMVVDGVVTAGQSSASYRRMSSLECTLCDIQQKAVIEDSGRLQAIILKGGCSEHEVKFRVGHYRCHKESTLPVALSIKNTNKHISCSMEGDTAVLRLEECIKDDLKQFSDESMKRFLFYKRHQGISLTMFESVMCSDWFISTSPDETDQTVEMCKEVNHRLTSFQDL